MNTQTADSMEENLEKLLKLWRPNIPQPLAFKRRVWSRIERSGSSEGWLDRFLVLFTQWRTASLAVTLSILGGALVGYATGARSGQTAYLQAVDPYAQVSSK
ncbi:MAG TPA: hypothetical protein VIS99_08575 [Terrimicrobiaceae bacterium]